MKLIESILQEFLVLHALGKEVSDLDTEWIKRELEAVTLKRMVEEDPLLRASQFPPVFADVWYHADAGYHLHARLTVSVGYGTSVAEVAVPVRDPRLTLDDLQVAIDMLKEQGVSGNTKLITSGSGVIHLFIDDIVVYRSKENGDLVRLVGKPDARPYPARPLGLEIHRYKKMMREKKG